MGAKIRFLVEEDETFDVKLWVKQEGRLLVSTKHTSGWMRLLFKVRMWDWGSKRKLRKEATVYDQNIQTYFTDRDKYDELKLVRLLESWNLHELDPKMQLHRVEGRLSDETYRLLIKSYPNLAEALLEAMNNVLELGQ